MGRERPFYAAKALDGPPNGDSLVVMGSLPGPSLRGNCELTRGASCGKLASSLRKGGSRNNPRPRDSAAQAARQRGHRRTEAQGSAERVPLCRSDGGKTLRD